MSADRSLPDTSQLDEDRHQAEEGLDEHERQKAGRYIPHLLDSAEQLSVDIKQFPPVQQLRAATSSFRRQFSIAMRECRALSTRDSRNRGIACTPRLCTENGAERCPPAVCGAGGTAAVRGSSMTACTCAHGQHTRFAVAESCLLFVTTPCFPGQRVGGYSLITGLQDMLD